MKTLTYVALMSSDIDELVKNQPKDTSVQDLNGDSGICYIPRQSSVQNLANEFGLRLVQQFAHNSNVVRLSQDSRHARTTSALAKNNHKTYNMRVWSYYGVECTLSRRIGFDEKLQILVKTGKAMFTKP